MWFCYVTNNIDFSASFIVDDPMIAVMWCISQLRGPCRSGGAHIYTALSTVE